MGPSTAVVIEDDPDHRSLLETLLHGLGLAVHTVATGPEGVDAIRHLNPDLIITGLNLPGFGGTEVIRRARVVTAAPIMIVSASNDLLDLEAGLGAGADCYVPEPFRPNVLRAYAHALLHRTARPATPTGFITDYSPARANCAAGR